MGWLHVNFITDIEYCSVYETCSFICLFFRKCCRVVLRKQVHKKTVIRDGQEETLVTENTRIEQDSDGPEELRETVQEVIDRFMEASDNSAAGESH